MSNASFRTFLANAAADPSQATDVLQALSTPEDLAAYAQARGYALTLGEAEPLMAEAREKTTGPQALSDDSLDHVSGAGPRKAQFS